MPQNGRTNQQVEDDEFFSEPKSATKAGPGRKKKSKLEEEVCDKPAPGIEEGIEVKTKFPVARIKRIMQADEDVGKVAQVTPTAVCKFLNPMPIFQVFATNDAYSKSTRALHDLNSH